MLNGSDSRRGLFGHRRTGRIAKDGKAAVTLPVGTKRRINTIGDTGNVGEAKRLHLECGGGRLFGMEKRGEQREQKQAPKVHW